MFIQDSQLSIHDISRVRAKKVGEYFRLNMPFEFGVDWAYKHFMNRHKQFLILESKSHTASRALSDLSGCDFVSHEDKPEKLNKVIRDWLINFTSKKNIPGASHIWDQYNFFNVDLYKKEKHSTKDIDNMTIPELLKNMKEWIQIQKL